MNSSISGISTIKLYMMVGEREQPAPTCEQKATFVIGRHVDCDLRLPLPDVSRRHARVENRDGKWHVNDLQSLNGVQVNGEPVLQAELKTGDRLKIGGFVFRVECVPAS